jgi:excisionase family DNA binding protein
MNSDDLFTAPQVAKICSTDLKTIHNWVNRDEIKSFRTPGRHLRFRREDILEFLTRYGYPIPDGFSPARQRVVLCEEHENLRRNLKRALSRDFDVEAYDNEVHALLAVGRGQPSLVLLGDVKDLDMERMVERLASPPSSVPVAIYGRAACDESTGKNVEFIPATDGREISRRVRHLLSGQ